MPDAKTSDDGKAARGPRTLVVFADGTGNAFATSRTNIWQLYCALDKSGGGQIARYIPGVGTSPNRILRMIDGAIGYGVPSNVRKLYRFLCWNWQPEDRIMLFGFSRGAFTVRTLAGLIAHQGLMPRERDGRQVGTAEMRRNAKGAWRAYRAASATNAWFTVTLMRRLRNGLVAAKRRLFGQDQHRVLEAEVAKSPRRPVWPKGQTDPAFPDRPGAGVRVDFLGVFDTVEAFGMPVEELRRVIGPLIYPLSFSNGICAPSVDCARHALAVDEERLSFRNVSFEHPKDDGGNPQERAWQDVKQRWFPGVHSDIGGGYPDDHGSVLPLQWMVGEARAVGLRVHSGLDDELKSRRFDLAPIHDSRRGLSAAHRYQPRRIGPEEEVDPLLLTKLRGGADLYGPISLREGCRIAGGAPLAPMRRDDRRAIDGMAFRYRFLNRVVIAIIVFFALYPLRSLSETDAAGRLTILSLGWKSWLIDGWMKSGGTGLALFVAGAALYLSGWGLKDTIRDTAAAGWQDGKQPPPPVGRLWRAGARLPPRVLEIAFALTIVVLAGWVLAANWGGLKRGMLAGAHCTGQDGTEPAVGAVHSLLFDPGQPCIATGIQMREGQRFAVHIQSEQGFCDRHIPVQTGGAGSPTTLMRLFEGIRRVDAPWLAPVFQIGKGPGKPVDGQIPTDPANWPCPTEAKGADFHGTFIAESTGPLYLYANDMKVLPAFFYGNNSGLAEVFVTRTK